MSKPRTLIEILTAATKHLQASGSDTPRLDAEVLLGHVLGLERIQLYVQHDRPLVPEELNAYRRVIARRARREPVAYIVGMKEFRSLTFRIDRRVLVPRPETEILVEEALRELEARFPAERHGRVADVGTGSGAIAVAMAKERAALHIVATDVDPAALDLARENVRLHSLSDRVELRRGDLLAPLAAERFWAVVSNPPYIAESEWGDLPPEVRVYEPKGALLAGKDGLAVIRRLVDEAPGVLVPGGFLALEIGAGQAEAVVALARERGYASWRVVKDLAGRDRVVVLGLGSASV